MRKLPKSTTKSGRTKETNQANKNKEKPKKTASAKGLRLQAKSFFLTFPQCSTPKNIALENLKKLLGSNLLGASVALEHHADGQPHLHLAVFLLDQLRTRDVNYFDCVVGKHGNYQAIRSVRAVLDYVSKADKEVLTYGTLPIQMSALRQSKSTIVAEMIRSGSSVTSIIKAHPGYSLQNLMKIRTFQSYCTELEAKESLLSLPLPIRPPEEANTDQLSIIGWLNTNLFTARKFKQRQLYLYGITDSGKTSLVMNLMRALSIYWIPNGEDFYDLYEDNKYDLAVIDEFKGDQKKIQWLNLFLQGLPMNLRVKGGQVMKKQNIPTIILSNFSPQEAYPKIYIKDATKLETFLSRITVVGPVNDIHFTPEWWDSIFKQVESGSSSSSSSTSSSTTSSFNVDNSLRPNDWSDDEPDEILSSAEQDEEECHQSPNSDKVVEDDDVLNLPYSTQDIDYDLFNNF